MTTLPSWVLKVNGQIPYTNFEGIVFESKTTSIPGSGAANEPSKNRFRKTFGSVECRT